MKQVGTEHFLSLSGLKWVIGNGAAIGAVVNPPVLPTLGASKHVLTARVQVPTALC